VLNWQLHLFFFERPSVALPDADNGFFGHCGGVTDEAVNFDRLNADERGAPHCAQIRAPGKALGGNAELVHGRRVHGQDDLAAPHRFMDRVAPTLVLRKAQVKREGVHQDFMDRFIHVAGNANVFRKRAEVQAGQDHQAVRDLERAPGVDRELGALDGALAGDQQELPFAMVYGQAVMEMPLDLYIPPDALEVFLEAFEGPLDLLLYLIRKQNINILDIPVAEITRQYMGYVELMQSVRLELAAEYLVMAAMLAEIKSRMLLPRSETVEAEEDDPRAELIRRLQEYERFKAAAEGIDGLSRVGRDVVVPKLDAPEARARKLLPDVSLEELLMSMAEVLRRGDMFESHQVSREALSTRERMSDVLERLKGGGFVPFVELFTKEEGRLGVVVTFMAVLELVKESLVELVQNEPFAAIHVRARAE